MNLPRIEPGFYTAGSNSTGITMQERLTFQYQGTSKNYSKNTNIASPPSHNIVPSPKQYGAKAQTPIPVNIFPKLSPDDIKEIQQIIDSILYYARAVNITVLMALSSIAIKQTKGTTNTMEKVKQLLDYLATNPDATIQFRESDMIMNLHSNMSYLSEANAQSRACGHFFMG
jgi:hypothetical protein